MTKRKRESPVDPIEPRKQEVRDQLLNSQKLLHRALKPAKGFTRQKLGKRLKHAQDKGREGYKDARRIKKEIEAWHTLDLAAMAEAHLCRTICKVKRMVKSEILPEEIREKGLNKEGGEGEGEGVEEKEKREARSNVMSGMFNTPGVKTTMGELMRGMYLVMRVPLPEKPVKGKIAMDGRNFQAFPPKGILKMKALAKTKDDDVELSSDPENEWEGIESSDEKPPRKTKQEIEEEEYVSTSDLDAAQNLCNNKKTKHDNQESGSDLDEDQFLKYDALVGSSGSESDSNSDSEPEIVLHPPFKRLVEAPSLPPPPRHPKSIAKPTSHTKATVFLPTLLGGYFSGSESEASDIDEDLAPIVKKNRPGQMARRAIWEKKFGTGANHIKSGTPSISQPRDEGWNAKRGADAGNRTRGRGSGRHRGGGNISRGGFGATGENAMLLGRGERGMGRKDDVGVLHPSWQAAKKAKAEKKAAKFEGKKVTFD